MDIGRVGVWTRTDGFAIGESAEFAQHVESLGYGALWIPDAFGRAPFAHAAWLFAHTSRLVVATGVVNNHLREAQATRGHPQRPPQKPDADDADTSVGIHEEDPSSSGACTKPAVALTLRPRSAARPWANAVFSSGRPTDTRTWPGKQ